MYPDVGLNQELYRWLALLAGEAGDMRHWARDNQRWTQNLLQNYPALRSRYQRLVEAHLQLRPDPRQLGTAEVPEGSTSQGWKHPSEGIASECHTVVRGRLVRANLGKNLDR